MDPLMIATHTCTSSNTSFANVSAVDLSAIIVLFIFLWYDHYYKKAKAKGAAWTSKEVRKCVKLTSPFTFGS